MLIVLREEFDTIPFGYLDDKIYNRIRDKFVTLLCSEVVADALLAKYWHKTLRELSCNSVIDVMSCFVLL